MTTKITDPDNAQYVLGDDMGFVALKKSSGEDIDIVNSARVSFDKESDSFNRFEEAREVGRSTFFDHPDEAENFGDMMQELEADCEKDRKLIRFLLKHKHGTPLEHNSMTFHIKCPLFIARQWMRHRIGVSYSEISYRYGQPDMEFYIPGKFRSQSVNNRQASDTKMKLDDDLLDDIFCSTIQNSTHSYLLAIENGLCREQARGLLPTSLYTQFYFTCNLRSLLAFIELRIHEGAQWEIQQYAKALLDQAESIFPETIKIWRELNDV